MQITRVTDQQSSSSAFLNKTKGRGSGILRVLASNPKIAIGIAVVAFFPRRQSLLKYCRLPHSFVEKILWGDGRTKIGGKAVYESKESGHFVPVMLQAFAFSPVERPIVERSKGLQKRNAILGQHIIGILVLLDNPCLL